MLLLPPVLAPKLLMSDFTMGVVFGLAVANRGRSYPRMCRSDSRGTRCNGKRSANSALRRKDGSTKDVGESRDQCVSAVYCRLDLDADIDIDIDIRQSAPSRMGTSEETDLVVEWTFLQQRAKAAPMGPVVRLGSMVEKNLAVLVQWSCL